LDVRDPEQWKQCVDQVLAIDKKIDVLIQCASVVKFASIESTSLADWRNVLEINLDGVFLGIKTILPIMKKQRRGVLLQIGSYLASRPSPGLASYCVSKAAVETLTRTAALEAAAASPDIRVNAILPGGVKTGIWKSHPAWNQLVQVGKSENAAFQALANSTPQKRFAEPEEIAQLSLYLASDAARFVTGALWSIDGGITA
jgi:NAD(P)-dependent dehydrogenase (short-subunit alcohol dehydrogenase family)